MRSFQIPLLALLISVASCAPQSIGPHPNVLQISGVNDFDSRVASPLAPPRIVVQFTGPG